MQSDDELDSKLETLEDAIEAEDSVAILEWIHNQTFTLVSLGGEDGETAAMIMDTEAFPALVVFLDEESAEVFVQSIADQIDGEEVETFLVAGADLLEPLPEEFGILINPDSECPLMIEPGLLHDLGDASEDDE